MTNQYKVRRVYTPLFYCQNCGKKFYNAAAARSAESGCCPKCGAVGQIKPWNVAGMPFKAAAPPPPPPAPAAPKPAARRGIPKLFASFIDGQCKNLKLAAKIVGISPKPPLLKKTIRACWIAQIAKHHPDRGGKVESAQAINAAYQLLQKFAR